MIYYTYRICLRSRQLNLSLPVSLFNPPTDLYQCFLLSLIMYPASTAPQMHLYVFRNINALRTMRVTGLTPDTMTCLTQLWHAAVIPYKESTPSPTIIFILPAHLRISFPALLKNGLHNAKHHAYTYPDNPYKPHTGCNLSGDSLYRYRLTCTSFHTNGSYGISLHR